MSSVTRTRVAAAFGVLSVILTLVGLQVHGYPALAASGEDLVHWATTTNQQQFALGITIEAVGQVLWLLFAAWLWSIARTAEGAPGWIATAGFSAAVVEISFSGISNGIWSAVLDAGQRGTNPQTVVGMRDMTQHIFESSALFGGLFFALIGYVLFRTRALPRWVSVSAAVLGLGSMIPSLFYVFGMLPFIWTVAVSMYLLVRPTAVALVRDPSDAVVISPAARTA